jgi:tetratricopeptide (TPR) repeat protein
MSGLVKIAQDSGVIRQLLARQSQVFRVLKIAGVILAIAGMQAYGFNRHFNPWLNQANQHLDRLAAEISANEQVDAVLGRLADLRRTTQNDTLRTEIVQTYERFIGEFPADPNTAIADFVRVVNIYAVPQDSLEAEILVTLKQELGRLQELYRDHYSELKSGFESPPIYLQPTAALLKRDGELARKIDFNHALYLSLTGDRTTANTIFNQLKSDQQDQQFMSLLHYAQARMLYDAFVAQNNMEYFQQAIQNLQESLRNDPGYGMPKLFLEYLLSMERSMQSEDIPQQGEGSGEAEGERGVMSSHPPTF